VRLTADEVHVWHAELDPWVERVLWLTQILSPDKRARAERFCFPGDRQHFIICRGLLRVILSRYSSVENIMRSEGSSRYG
jgi:4'-phosphopantetheinyl transferase